MKRPVIEELKKTLKEIQIKQNVLICTKQAKRKIKPIRY